MDDLQSVLTSLYQHATKFYCIVVDLTRFKDNSIPLQRNERNRKAGFMLLLGYDVTVLPKMINVIDLNWKTVMIDIENQ